MDLFTIHHFPRKSWVGHVVLSFPRLMEGMESNLDSWLRLGLWPWNKAKLTGMDCVPLTRRAKAKPLISFSHFCYNISPVLASCLSSACCWLDGHLTLPPGAAKDRCHTEFAWSLVSLDEVLGWWGERDREQEVWLHHQAWVQPSRCPLLHPASPSSLWSLPHDARCGVCQWFLLHIPHSTFSHQCLMPSLILTCWVLAPLSDNSVAL